MKWGLNFGFQGQGLFGTPLTGNYIWYTLDPDTGFYLDGAGNRYVNDEGNTVIVGATGQYDGSLYASNHVYLNGTDQSVDVPLDVTLGVEEVVNGTFDTDVSGWTENVPNALSWDNGTALISTVADTTWDYATQTMTLVAGQTYLFEGEIVETATSSRRITIGNAAQGTEYGLFTGVGSYTTTFTPTQNDVVITIQNTDGVAGTTTNFDNISVQEIQAVNTQSLLYYSVGSRTFTLLTNLEPSTSYNITESFSQLLLSSTKTFTDADVAYLNDNPDALMDLFTGRQSHDELSFTLADFTAFYPANDAESGAFIQDVMQPLGADNIVNGTFDTDTNWTKGAGWTISNGVASYDGTNASYANLQQSVPVVDNIKKFRIDFDITAIAGTITVLLGATGGVQSGSFGTVGRYSVLNRSNHNEILYFQCYGSATGTIDNVSIREVQAIEINNYTEACRTTYKNTNFGPTDIFYLKDSTGRLTGDSVGTNHLMRFNQLGAYVDTGVSVDGSQTDFTMMLGFTLPDINTGDTQYLVGPYTAGDANGLHLRHDIYLPLNELTAKIGKYSQIMTFDESNPIHAMVVVFNSTTSQLQIAIDGEPLSAPFDIVFDGPTAPILLGANVPTSAFNIGYIGEGIFSDSVEDERVWQWFWDRVK